MPKNSFATEKVKIENDNIIFNHTVFKNKEPENYVYHTHDRYELLLFLKGDMQYFVEGRRYDLAFGDLILTRPSVLHCVVPNSVTNYERYDAIIDERLIDKSILDSIPEDRDVFRCADNDRVFDLFSRLDFYYGKFNDAQIGRIAFNAMEEVLYNLAIADSNGTSGVINPIVDKAVSYINENLTTIKCIEEISDALYLTRSHLHHLFSENLQMTPAKYILSKRLMKAQRKILRGAKPTDVYTECGFDDYTTFFRNYKKHFGYPPSSTDTAEITREIL